MVLSIKSERVDRMARELAALTGESITDAVEGAIAARLALERQRQKPGTLDDIVARFADLVTKEPDAGDVAIDYDEHGLPR